MVNICGARIEVFIFGLCIVNALASTSENSVLEKCENGYRRAVYNELMRAIEIINTNASSFDRDNLRNSDQPGIASTINDPALLRRFQEDEDYGGGGGEGGGAGAIGGIDIPSIVPMIFKIVGSALSLNSTGVHANSQGLISMRLSNRLTSILGNLASSILGPVKPTPTPRPPPPRRRRRSTTTTPASSNATELKVTEVPTSPNKAEATTLPADIDSSELNSIELQETSPLSFAGTVNETTFLFMAEVVNVTEAPAAEVQQEESRTAPGETAEASVSTMTTTKVLYNDSLGLLPIYAPNYAPNYVPTPTTTAYPIYAPLYQQYMSKSTTPVSTTDPNSYQVAGLPFDYQVDSNSILINGTSSTTVLTTVDPNVATTPNIDYEEYEYEERTEFAEALEAARSEAIHIEQRLNGQDGTTIGSELSRSITEAEDDEYLDSDASKNRSSLSSLGRISKLKLY